jgi:hypothetical protein
MLLMLCISRFILQLYVLIAIKLAKREVEDKKIKLAILKEKIKFKNQQKLDKKS